MIYILEDVAKLMEHGDICHELTLYFHSETMFPTNPDL